MSDEVTPRLWAPLTPTGIRIDLIASFDRLIALLKEAKIEEALDYAETFRELFVATAQGRFDLIERGYEVAIVKNFEAQLSATDELAKLLEEDE